MSTRDARVQAHCLTLEATPPAEARDGHAESLERAKAARDATLAELAALEKDVYMHRGLLEEEEEITYCAAIDELEAVYAQMEDLRAAQGRALTPWVRR